MSPNRKAELQRKLSMPPVARPPAGLAERIKRDIPKQLRFDAEAERKRFARSITASLRVAAAVLVLTLSAVGMLHVLTRMESEKAAASNERPVPAARSEPAAKPEPPAATVAPTESPAIGSAAARSAPATPAPARVAVKRRVRKQTPAAEGLAGPPLAETAPAPAAAAAQSKVAATFSARDETAPFPIQEEATVSPVTGKTMLRVTVGNAPDARLNVDGARKVSPNLYEMERDRATIRLTYRQDGEQKKVEKTVTREDARPWSSASEELKDAVRRAEKGPPP